MRQALHAISGLDHLCVECALEGLDQRQSRSWAARRNGSGVRSRSPFCGVDESCPSLDCPAPVSGSPDGYRYCRLTPVSRGNAIREWSGCAPEVPTFVSRHPYGPTSQKRTSKAFAGDKGISRQLSGTGLSFPVWVIQDPSVHGSADTSTGYDSADNWTRKGHWFPAHRLHAPILWGV
jgi:hypothetical protein